VKGVPSGQVTREEDAPSAEKRTREGGLIKQVWAASTKRNQGRAVALRHERKCNRKWNKVFIEGDAKVLRFVEKEQVAVCPPSKSMTGAPEGGQVDPPRKKKTLRWGIFRAPRNYILDRGSIRSSERGSIFSERESAGETRGKAAWRGYQRGRPSAKRGVLGQRIVVTALKKRGKKKLPEERARESIENQSL